MSKHWSQNFPCKFNCQTDGKKRMKNAQAKLEAKYFIANNLLSCMQLICIRCSFNQPEKIFEKVYLYCVC